MNASLWSPSSPAEALRQGQPRRQSLRDRVETALGIESFRSRRARNLRRRLMPYLVVISVAAGALGGAMLQLM